MIHWVICISIFYKKRHYYHLFDYIQWNEKLVENTIIKNYDWETCIDTKSTWRIGDGTASFYNYIYTLVVGFSENDTFRSNQIRDGLITRGEALDLIYEENIPRYNSIKWYLEILNLDFEDTIKKINKIKSIITRICLLNSHIHIHNYKNNYIHIDNCIYSRMPDYDQHYLKLC